MVITISPLLVRTLHSPPVRLLFGIRISPLLVLQSKDFSVYAIVYTVDFAYELDGKVYEFSLDGGESIRLSELVELLGIHDAENGQSVRDFMKNVRNWKK